MGQRVCPRCQAVFSGPGTGLGDKELCPHDGTRLVPAGTAAAGRSAQGELKVGQLLDGRFEIERLLGRGGLGTYLARHRALSRQFVIKLLRKDLAGSELARFQREARALSTVVHPNLAGLYDYGQTAAGQPYLVTEYVEGLPLHALLGRSSSRQLPLVQALELTAQVLRALVAAHARGLVHLNIKPENILLVSRGGQPGAVKVTDLGVARILDGERLAGAGSPVGAPEFIAPELLTRSDVGPAADLYAIGVLLHTLIAGSPPFTGTVNAVLSSHLNQRPPALSLRCPERGVPKELDALVSRLLGKVASGRPTAEEALATLQQLRAQQPPRPVRCLLVLDALVRGAVPLERTPAAESTIERTGAAAELELPPILCELEQVEHELERTSQQLLRQILALVKRRWPYRPPSEIADQQRLLSSSEEAAEELGLRLALLNDEADKEAERSEARQEELRAQMRRVHEQLTTAPAERPLREVQLAFERAYDAVTFDGPATSALARLRPRLQELRSEIQRRRRDIGALVLRRCKVDSRPSYDRTIQVAVRGLEKALAEVDRLSTTLARLLARVSPRP